MINFPLVKDVTREFYEYFVFYLIMYIEINITKALILLVVKTDFENVVEYLHTHTGFIIHYC